MTTTHTEAPTVSRDGLAAELLKRRRKRLPALSAALAIAAVLGLGVIGGVEAQKHWGTTTSSSSRASGVPSGFPAGGVPSAAAFARGGFGGGGAAGGGTSGTVTLIKGATLYVTDASGNTVMVRTSARSRVTKTVAGTVKTVHPGDSLTVVGTQNKDGSYSARQLTIGAASNG